MKNLACIVLKANGCGWDSAHVTILFLGKTNQYREGMKNEILSLLFNRFKAVTFACVPQGNNSWSVHENKTAFPVVGERLESLRYQLENALSTLGVKDASQYPWNPHITTPNPMIENLPIYIELTPLQLWWRGDIYDIN